MVINYKNRTINFFSIIRIITTDYDKCYSEREYEGYAAMGCCGGLVGGTSATDYLSEMCCSCPHLVLGCKEESEL